MTNTDYLKMAEVILSKQHDRAWFDALTDTAGATYDQISPGNTDEIQAAWITAMTWILLMLNTCLREGVTAQEMAIVIKGNMDAMTVAISQRPPAQPCPVDQPLTEIYLTEADPLYIDPEEARRINDMEMWGHN
jgi:hypothetical protein